MIEEFFCLFISILGICLMSFFLISCIKKNEGSFFEMIKINSEEETNAKG